MEGASDLRQQRQTPRADRRGPFPPPNVPASLTQDDRLTQAWRNNAVTPSCRLQQNKNTYHVTFSSPRPPPSLTFHRRTGLRGGGGRRGTAVVAVAVAGGGCCVVNSAASFNRLCGLTLRPLGPTPTHSSNTAALTVDSERYGNTPHSSG